MMEGATFFPMCIVIFLNSLVCTQEVKNNHKHHYNWFKTVY